MGDVGGGEIIGFELGLEHRYRGINEETWVGGAGAAPDYVGWGAVVPGCSLGEDSRCFGGGGEICGYGLETLRFVDSTGLARVEIRESLRAWNSSTP